MIGPANCIALNSTPSNIKNNTFLDEIKNEFSLINEFNYSIKEKGEWTQVFIFTNQLELFLDDKFYVRTRKYQSGMKHKLMLFSRKK